MIALSGERPQISKESRWRRPVAPAAQPSSRRNPSRAAPNSSQTRFTSPTRSLLIPVP